MMTVRAHSLATRVAAIGVFAAATAPFIGAIRREERSLLVVLAPAAAAALAARFAFRKLVPARCVDERCMGRMFPQGANPAVYRCDVCGKTAESGFEPDGPDGPADRT